MREFLGSLCFAIIFYLGVGFVVGNFGWPVDLWHMSDGGAIRFVALIFFIFWVILGSTVFL
jgi:uncharacterized membrane protein